jgi:serine phosphatase RsbU (regulator of sigma subunit)
MSLFEPNGVRMATVRAKTDVELLEITRKEFDLLLHRQPGLTYQLVRELSKRLTDAHEASIRDLREKNRELGLAYDDLKAAQTQLVEKERLEKELAVAREIQQSILPHQLPMIRGVDLCARVLPSRAVGGDLFDLIDLGDGKLGVAIADVSDKGVPAAIFMSLTRSLLRAEAARSSSPVDVIKNVNSVLLEMNEAGMFVTVLYGVVDLSLSRFHYVRAGHELPIIVDASGAIVDLACGKGQPLGLFENPALDEQSVGLGLPATIVLSTDGVTDQVDEVGEYYGAERFRNEVLRNKFRPAPSLCQNLIDAINVFRARAPQVDDITLVVVKLSEA